MNDPQPQPQYPKLGRLIEFDPRSKLHPITAVLPTKAIKPRSYQWRCKAHLDQGQEGACVGFGWSHELSARPCEIQNVSNETAYQVYKEAQKLDQWPGESYEGTSVIAGIKAVQKLYPEAIEGYKWAFSIEEVVATLGYFGPVVLGVHWYEKMFEPDSDGFIHVAGAKVGGHCILARGVNVKGKFVILRNSWGSSWGKDGDCYITFDDLSTLLEQEGEACIPIGRKNCK